MGVKFHIVNIMVLLVATASFATETPIREEMIPAAFDICSSFTAEEAPRVYSKETMYEHINGEAELFKRFGARRLLYASFSAENGDSFTVEIIDFRTMESALGIFRLYSGCDEDTDEVDLPGFRISRMGTSAFALKGNLFIRVYTFVDRVGCDDLVERVIEKIFSRAETGGHIPHAAKVLEGVSGRKCDVSFHPDETDMDRNYGPGYRWKDTEGNECFMRILGSEDEAKTLYGEISRDGEVTVVSSGHVVAWTGAKGEKINKYLAEVVGDVRTGDRK